LDVVPEGQREIAVRADSKHEPARVRTRGRGGAQAGGQGDETSRDASVVVRRQGARATHTNTLTCASEAAASLWRV
jgi:hypothetical protein